MQTLPQSDKSYFSIMYPEGDLLHGLLYLWYNLPDMLPDFIKQWMPDEYILLDGYSKYPRDFFGTHQWRHINKLRSQIKSLKDAGTLCKKQKYTLEKYTLEKYTLQKYTLKK